MNELIDTRKRDYPAGCRVVLDLMDDKFAPPQGTQGTVTGVDARGSIMVDWDNGSGLNVTDIDRVHKISTVDEAVATLNWYGVHQRETDSRCPRCGEIMIGPTTRHALSRYAQVYVCDRCGMEESLEKTGITEAKPLTEWCAIKIPSVGGGAWRR